MLDKKKLLTEEEKEIIHNYLKTGSKIDSFRLAKVNVSNFDTVKKFFEKEKVKNYIELCNNLSDNPITEKEIIQRISSLCRRQETEDAVTKSGKIVVRQSIKDQLKALEIMMKIMGIEKVNNATSNIIIIDDILTRNDKNETN